MKILGIDPGTTTIGYAIVEADWSKPVLWNFGIIETTAKESLEYKLLTIGDDFRELMNVYKPDIIAFEKLFFNTNITTGIDVAHARGVMMYFAKKSGAHILEYTPLEVKSAITGFGRADKVQLQNAIRILFWLESIPKPDDAADAIGLAYMWYLNRKLIWLK